jgi:hypothetical protein
MKTPKPILFLALLLMQLTLSAQVQWYQNQDGSNAPPYGTVATAVQKFTNTSFIACYLWGTANDQNTWKVSKSHTNGTEQKTFFVSGTTAIAEVRIGRSNTVYVLERSFPFGQNSQYIIYKLDSNLVVKAQRSISFPNSFNIFNLNAFELDALGNVYVAGDGQYQSGPGFYPASFVLKTNKNLETQWSRMDSTETSYTRLLIDRWGRVLVTEDAYAFFPQVRIRRFAYNGQPLNTFMVQTDAGRYSVNTLLDKDDNILMYGGKMSAESSQAIYLKRISRLSGNTMYSKTYFTALSSQLNDLKMDHHGNIFTLVTQYFGPDNQKCRISRIKLSNGNISWNRTINYSEDSCNLTRLVMNNNDRFYAVGEKRSHAYFSKGFAMRIKKSGGQPDGNFPAPDSVAFQRSHSLADGIIDNDNLLIAIGNTSDFDTTTFSSNYFRSFAVRFGSNNNCYGRSDADAVTDAVDEIEQAAVVTKLVIYPNPVQNQLTISSINPEEYNLVTVYNMHGAMLQQQTVNSTSARMDISHMPDGVYLLTLRSSATLKEKSIKFVVKK